MMCYKDRTYDVPATDRGAVPAHRDGGFQRLRTRRYYLDSVCLGHAGQLPAITVSFSSNSRSHVWRGDAIDQRVAAARGPSIAGEAVAFQQSQSTQFVLLWPRCW